MPDGYADEVRDALLTKAREAWQDDPALDAQALGDGSGDDSISCYLRAYYQRVATEDLAPPSRLAAVAEDHARLGLNRPQGRALVQVGEPSDGQLHPVSRSGLVVDIVTDDMPYLVDSVTTELNRHEAEIRLLVHPLLRVRRDVTGALRGILGVCGDVSTGIPGEPVADEITESWIHVELGPPRDNVTADQLAAALRHVLDDVRVAVEDQARMGAMARSLAGDLGGEPGSDRAEHGDLLRWLADGNFLFLGYREYDLVRTDDGAGLRAVPGTGLGILRHARPGKESVRKMSTQVARRAQEGLGDVLGLGLRAQQREPLFGFWQGGHAVHERLTGGGLRVDRAVAVAERARRRRRQAARVADAGTEAALHDVEKGPVGEPGVIAVHAVFELQLPVRGHGDAVCLVVRDQRQPEALVEEAVDVADGAGPEVVRQRRHGGRGHDDSGDLEI